MDDGQRLIKELDREGFDVSVAFWVKGTEEGIWHLYIGSASVDSGTVGDAYRTLYACLKRIPDPWVSVSNVRIIRASDSAAKAASAARDRNPMRLPFRFRGSQLGDLSVEEAYIYPKASGPMTPGEVLQALFEMANRPPDSVARPSQIALRDGSTLSALVTGFNFQMPGGLTIDTLDLTANTNRKISGDDVVSIR
jgi:hypothetical protein